MLLFGQRVKYQLNKSLFAGRQGFSLLETAIAISILVFSILGPMTLSSQSIRSASVARNTIIASNLAQEGIELVKNIRLNNRIEERDWMRGLNNCKSVNGCYIDAKDLDVRQCASNCSFLRFDNSLKLYNYNSGSDSVFRRIITISDINAREIRVRSLVKWTDKFGNHDFFLSTSMFDW